MYTMYNVQCTMYNVQYTMYNIQCTMYNVQCTMHNIQCTMYIMCIVHNAHVFSEILTHFLLSSFTFSILIHSHSYKTQEQVTTINISIRYDIATILAVKIIIFKKFGDRDLSL